MAVAAYASVISLSHVLDQVQHPSRLRLLPNKTQIETLHEKVHFLQELLEHHHSQIEDLARRIAEVAYEAEIVIDFHVVNQLGGLFDDRGYIWLAFFSREIDEVIEKIESITKELLSMVRAEGKDLREKQLTISVSAGPSTLPSGGKSTVVGLDENLDQIMHDLTGDQPDLQIIPITGTQETSTKLAEYCGHALPDIRSKSRNTSGPGQISTYQVGTLEKRHESEYDEMHENWSGNDDEMEIPMEEPPATEYAKQQGLYESLHRGMKVAFRKWDFSPMELDNPFPDGQEGSVQ